ncbi:hypothetical protein K431DRAFT_283862 [Polychaeton citri CBS 116435]|uniref:Carboxymuconolactone decarboxylase-like domain-containing protein n=1 Tax=Polychaeton citri CBS 116435 TaxID=1314669 RepID=A0A9P4QCS9_9PEZI|nr:hypothetical protein K431DRAFT_283862 [Polychaeton citri CBS 116435]
MSSTEQTAEATRELFQEIETHFPSQALGKSKWEILAVAAITAGGQPERAADLYRYLTSKPEYQTPEQRHSLIKRLREALFKLICIIGVPRCLEAIFTIAPIEKEEDRDYSFSRENWQSGEENEKRGRRWLSQLYCQNLGSTIGPLSAHRDFMWTSVEITYGLYLSDHSIIDGVDTELVVLSGLMLQNLKNESAWHLRGIRRLGVKPVDVETIHQCIEKVAEFCGVSMSKVPRVDDIEHEV